jgi:hypothetical protein
VDAMAYFYPDSDIVTLINIPAPLLADRNYDLESLERLSVHPSIHEQFRSDVDEFNDLLGFDETALTAFSRLNAMELVDSKVVFMISNSPKGYGARTFSHSDTFSQLDIGKFCPSSLKLFNSGNRREATLDFRPGQPSSSVPNQCLSF